MRTLTITLAAAAMLCLTGCLFFASETPLSQAASSGNLLKVKDLLRSGTNPNETDSMGHTALIGAARAGQPEAIHLLIHEGADPNLRGGVNDWTPLMHAIHKGQKASVIALLRDGAEVDRKMADGSTALTMAAGYGYSEIVKVLLDEGADPYTTAAGGVTPLVGAIRGSADHDRFTVGNCQTETVKALVTVAPGTRLPRNGAARWARTAAWVGGCKEAIRLAESGTR